MSMGTCLCMGMYEYGDVYVYACMGRKKLLIVVNKVDLFRTGEVGMCE